MFSLEFFERSKKNHNFWTEWCTNIESTENLREHILVSICSWRFRSSLVNRWFESVLSTIAALLVFLHFEGAWWHHAFHTNPVDHAGHWGPRLRTLHRDADSEDHWGRAAWFYKEALETQLKGQSHGEAMQNKTHCFIQIGCLENWKANHWEVMATLIHIILGTARCHGTLPSKHCLRPAVYAKCEHISLATRWKSSPRRDRSSPLMWFDPAYLMQFARIPRKKIQKIFVSFTQLLIMYSFTKKHLGWTQSPKPFACLYEVSSAMCSILLGSYAPVDTSDGSGTNLNNLQETLAETGNSDGQRKRNFPSHEVMTWGQILSKFVSWCYLSIDSIHEHQPEN